MTATRETLREAVAEAIYKADDPWSEAFPWQKLARADALRELADAALAAIEAAGWRIVPTPETADIAGLVERALAVDQYDDHDTYKNAPLFIELATALQSLSAELAEARRDLNKYAYERDKAREERDAAERRSEAFWKPQVTKMERLEKLVRVFLDNNPDELVADSGETVLDLFRYDARRALGGSNAE